MASGFALGPLPDHTRRASRCAFARRRRRKRRATPWSPLPAARPLAPSQVAERLYSQGYLSYPRTESSAYPPRFDFDTLLAAQCRHGVWGAYAASLISDGFAAPKGGVDAGDHPPITPVRSATEVELGGGDAWRLYE